jgi:PPOX class probable F420-dependent enzyme
MAQIEGRARELLEEGTNFVALATQSNGRPHLVVIWADVEDGKVALNSAEGRAWPREVRQNPDVSLVVVNHENPYEYAEIQGRVVEDTHEGADQHIDRLAKKYLGKDEYPFRQEGEQRVKFLVEPEKVRVQGA